MCRTSNQLPEFPLGVTLRRMTTASGERTSADFSLGYVAALDGLRAVAVVAVMMYHAEVPAARGGFLGVSVFFTLSGFLITTLLLNEEADRGSIDLQHFWRRRFRRLVPASWLTIALVVVMGMFGIWETEQLRSLRGDVPAALGQIINWRFVLSGHSYGDSFNLATPLQHYWSLAIEEQFYVIWPLLIAAAFTLLRRCTPSKRVKTLAVGIVVLATVSFVVDDLLARSSTDRSYFGTDTRAGELLVGALVACFMWQRPRIVSPRAARGVAMSSVLGLVGLGWLMWETKLTTHWLHPWGLIACSAATSALVVGALHGAPAASVLALRPLPQIGRISYGVYLLHWPVFLSLTPLRTGWGQPVLLPIRLAVTFAGAIAMYCLLERPVRQRHMMIGRAPVFAAPLLVIGMIGTQLATTRSLPDPPIFMQQPSDSVVVREALPGATSPNATATASSTSVASLPLPASSSNVPSTTTEGVVAESPPMPVPPSTSTTGAPVRTRRVLLVGDSVATTLESALGDELTARGISFGSAALAGCGVVTGDPADAEGAPLAMTAACSGAIPVRQQQGLSETRPDLVVVVSSWESYDRVVDGTWYRFESDEGQRVMRRLYDDTFARLSAKGAAVVG